MVGKYRCSAALLSTHIHIFGDYIGAAIARRFAREGYLVHAGRRNGEKLGPLVQEIEAAGGRCVGKTLDAREEDTVAGIGLNAAQD